MKTESKDLFLFRSLLYGLRDSGSMHSISEPSEKHLLTIGNQNYVAFGALRQTSSRTLAISEADDNFKKTSSRVGSLITAHGASGKQYPISFFDGRFYTVVMGESLSKYSFQGPLYGEKVSPYYQDSTFHLEYTQKTTMLAPKTEDFQTPSEILLGDASTGRILEPGLRKLAFKSAVNQSQLSELLSQTLCLPKFYRSKVLQVMENAMESDILGTTPGKQTHIQESKLVKRFLHIVYSASIETSLSPDDFLLVASLPVSKISDVLSCNLSFSDLYAFAKASLTTSTPKRERQLRL